MNGGAYNVLINTTSKPVASFAACLAVISYIATGVVSAATAISYLQVHTRIVCVPGELEWSLFFFDVLGAGALCGVFWC